MLMVVHASAGALIGEISQTALSAFSISFVLHFIMDLVPHGDHEIVARYRENKQVKKILSFLITDTLATLCLVVALFVSPIPFNEQLVFWGIAGALLPDIIVALYQVFEFRLLKKFNHFHYFIHDFFPEKKNKKLKFLPGLLLQILVIIFCLKIIL